MTCYVKFGTEVQQTNAENIFLSMHKIFKPYNIRPFSASDMHAVLFLDSVQVIYTTKDPT